MLAKLSHIIISTVYNPQSDTAGVLIFSDISCLRLKLLTCILMMTSCAMVVMMMMMMLLMMMKRSIVLSLCYKTGVMETCLIVIIILSSEHHIILRYVRAEMNVHTFMHELDQKDY